STTGAELLYTYQTAINPAQRSDGISYDLKNESFCLWSISGTNDVDNVVFNLQPIWPVNTLLLGDSITSGLMAESAEQSYASLLKRSLGPTVCNMGEPGATVGSITRTLPEINMLSPSNVVLMVGGNDIGSGDAIAAVKSGYASLVSQITNRGTIFHCLPTPWVNLGAMTNMVEFVCTNYPSSTWIDLYHPFLKNNTTDPLPSFYYTGDGIHPNAAGSAIIYRQIYNKLTGE
ncbi:MAG: SGNH/GDSL hydrolase family protein, partial [Verrucomicrobiota bacterium]